MPALDSVSPPAVSVSVLSPSRTQPERSHRSNFTGSPADAATLPPLFFFAARALVDSDDTTRSTARTVRMWSLLVAQRTGGSRWPANRWSVSVAPTMKRGHLMRQTIIVSTLLLACGGETTVPGTEGAAVCGNGSIESGEGCDGSNLNNQT